MHPTATGREDARPVVAREVAPGYGWVYCMQQRGVTQRGTDLTKFGYTSRRPQERAKDGTRTPAPLVVVRAWKSPEARLLERLVLRRLSNCRVAGTEWLALPVADVAEVVEATAAARGLKLELDPQAAG